MATGDARGYPWRDAALLVLLVVAAHWLRAGELPVRGEEGLRAQIGLEMARSGDWVVPRVQGEPFLSRPPLHNWLIAASCAAFGGPSAWAIRFPSLLAALLTVLLVHGYARTFLPRLGAFAAGAACATFAEMFTTYAQAETEAVFILLVAASLLVWHHGFTRGWPDLLLWPTAYALIALAMLAKGPQPPVYFAGAVGGWLLLTGQWRKALTLGHLAGIALCAALVAAWWVPCVQRIGRDATWVVFAGDSQGRFRGWTLDAVLSHLAVFPAETLACTLPWSPALLAFLLPSVRRALPATGHSSFLALACGLAFLSIWIPPAGMTRYYAPLYPCLAVLIGAALAACAEQGVLARASAVLVPGILGLAAFVALAPFAAPGTAVAEKPLPGLVLALALAACALPLLRRPGEGWAFVPALALFAALAVGGAMANVRARWLQDAGPAVARIKAALPPGTRLASIGQMRSLFLYHFGDPVEPRPIDGIEEGGYFVTPSNPAAPPHLPFAWEVVGFVSLDRRRSEKPAQLLVVGRRLPALAGR
ncbi:MAG: glycosyltransferase family 39 protein [Gemmataceae bacterium]|nr:glycosyltransferase family 39 protein [Gemmataceae bacterium]